MCFCHLLEFYLYFIISVVYNQTYLLFSQAIILLLKCYFCPINSALNYLYIRLRVVLLF